MLSEEERPGLREYVAGVVHDAWCKRASSDCRPMSYDYESADQILIAVDGSYHAIVAAREKPLREALGLVEAALQRLICDDMIRTSDVDKALAFDREHREMHPTPAAPVPDARGEGA